MDDSSNKDQEPSQDIISRVDYLAHEIDRHNYLYHTLNNPEIDDDTFDAMFRELQELETKWPQLQKSWSPTLRIGSTLLPTLPKKAHQTKMYSLDNVFSLAEWQEFYERMERLFWQTTTKHLPYAFWCDVKLDGLAIELIYVDGVLEEALTRGDGSVGEVVTAACRTIKTIPLKLHDTAPKLFTVRGEVVMYKDDFKALNVEQETLNRKLFANPRNAAAGSLRQLDLNVVRSRNLRFLAYNLGAVDWGEMQPIQKQSELIERLKSYGFLVPPAGKLCTNSSEIEVYIEDMNMKREQFPMEIDGCVAKLDDFEAQTVLGFTARAPRFAVAFKFKATEVETRLLRIDVQVGRTGTLTPVAILEPVGIGGVIVQRATLHNASEIAEKDLREGDYVIVRRAGEVIPEIVRPVIEKRTSDLKPYVFPKICPACGSPVFQEEGQTFIRCDNLACPAIRSRAIIHFVSKAGLDIQGLGEKWILQLVDSGVVRSPADIFALKLEDLLQFKGMGEILANKFLDSLEQAKANCTLEQLISALGILHVGQQTAKTLASHFQDLTALAKADLSSLEQLQDVGRETAMSIQNFFSTPANVELLERLRNYGLWPKAKIVEQNTNSPLQAKTILFTGSLSVSRSVAEKYATAAGAIVVSNISKKLNFLVVGDKPGSKLTKAKALGIQILDEQAFVDLLKECGVSLEK